LFSAEVLQNLKKDAEIARSFILQTGEPKVNHQTQVSASEPFLARNHFRRSASLASIFPIGFQAIAKGKREPLSPSSSQFALPLPLQLKAAVMQFSC
jgi:hypothetical protein